MASSSMQDDILTSELPPLPFHLESLDHPVVTPNGHHLGSSHGTTPILENGLDPHGPAFDGAQLSELADLPALPPGLENLGFPQEPTSALAVPQSDLPGKKTLGRMISSPLPPIDPFELNDEDYGPVSSTEPRLDSPTQSPSHDVGNPQLEQLSERYEFMRRTLSHSRRRYSARFKRPRPRPASDRDRDDVQEGDDAHEDAQSSLDLPNKQRRAVESSLDHPGHVRSTSSQQGGRFMAHPLQKRSTVHGVSAQAERTAQRNRMQEQDKRQSTPTHSALEARRDHLGRMYYLDHATHTLTYDRVPPTPDEQHRPDMTARREMLNRRYQSLQRSFRSAQRRNPGPNTSLTPTNAAGAISYTLTDDRRLERLDLTERERSESNRRSDSGRSQRRLSEEDATSSSSSRAKKGRSKSSKGWFSSLGRKAKSPSSIHQRPISEGGSSDQTLPVASPSADIFSPLSPPPNIEEFVGSSSSPHASSTEGDSIGHRSEVSTEEGLSLTAGSLERSGAESIFAALSMTEDVVEARESRLSNITDEDRAAALRAQKKIRATVRVSQSSIPGGDTDDETNEVTSSVSLDQRVEEKETPREESDREEEEEKGEREAEGEKDVPKDKASGEGSRRTSRGTRRLSRGLRNCPALKFITRQDLYTFLNSAGDAGEAFFANRAIMELVQRIRADTMLFEKYQHSRQLVQALNSFADVDAEMPKGWEKKLNKQGRVFFIDHTNRITTFIDPRLPTTNEGLNKPTTSQSLTPVSNVRRIYSTSDEPEIRPHHATVVHTQSLTVPAASVNPEVLESTRAPEIAYEDQIVAFFRQPNVLEKISQKYARGIRPQLREVVEDIRQNGFQAVERAQLSGRVVAYELTIILSLFEEEISNMRPVVTPAPSQETPQIVVEGTSAPGQEGQSQTLQRQKKDFGSKLQTFKLQLAQVGFAQGSRLKFNIRRDHLLEDSYEHVMKSDCRHLQRKRLNISFRGEEGLDYGGPSREFFFLLSREIFNPYYGLFEYSANDTYTIQISSTSLFIHNNLDWFRFAGRIIGLVIAQGFLLDVFFTRPVYKTLVGRPPTVKDLESLEPAFYNSLLWIEENDPEPLDLTFTVEEEAFGQLTTHELKQGGDDIPVLEDNKHEYIELMVRWRLDRGVHEQNQALLKGFNEVMPSSFLQPFDAQEIEFLIAGTLEIDVDDWKKHTEYRNGYHANHPVVLWFWQAVEMFDNEQRLRLLQFVTGTSSVPYEGFRALRGSSGPKRFCIDYFNDIRSLPRSHTCFNRIDLPPYPSFEILFEKLRVAIEEGGTFGVE